MSFSVVTKKQMKETPTWSCRKGGLEGETTGRELSFWKNENLVLDDEKLGKLLTNLWANLLGFTLEKFKLKDNVLYQEMSFEA